MGFPVQTSQKCTAIGAKLPQRPTLLLLSPRCPPFLHTVKPSHFTLHVATQFFYYLSTPFTQPLSKLLQVLLCSMLALGVHIMCWALLPLLGQIQPQNQSVVHRNIFHPVQLKRLRKFETSEGLVRALEAAVTFEQCKSIT